LPTQPALAQAAASGDELQEIVVTVERTASDVQKTGASVAVVSGTQLVQESRVTTAQILEDIPNVAVLQGNASLNNTVGADNQGSTIVIRGIPPSGIPVGPLQSVPTTAVYTDGVYEGIGNNYDVDHVEVLRGPQGTLYGRSATTGVVSTTTVDPVLGQFGGNAMAEVGDHSLVHYGAALNMPLGSTIAVRVSGNDYQHDGYVSSDGLDAINSSNGRVKVLFEPNSSLSLLLGAALQVNHQGGGGTQTMLVGPDTYQYQPAVAVSGLTQFQQYWANLNVDFGWSQLTYIPAYRTWYQDTHSYVPFLNDDPLLQRNVSPLDEFVTHELRLASKSGTALTWLIGSFFYDNHLHGSAIYPYPNGTVVSVQDAHKQTKNLGFFGEATYAFVPSTRVTAGLRYDYTYVQTAETVTQNANLFCNTPTFFFSPPSPGCVAGPPASPLAGTPVLDATTVLTPQAGTNRYYNRNYKGRLEQDLTSSNMLYAMISTGFVPGDVQVSTGQGNVPHAAPFAEETLTSYEVGSKNRFLNNTLQINADAFYYHYGAYQINLVANVANPASAETFAVPARALGAELDVDYLITPADRLHVGYGYTDAYFVDVPANFSSIYIESHIVNVPPQTVTGAYDHEFGLPNGSKLTAHLDGRVIGSNDVSSLRTSDFGQGVADPEAWVRANTAFIGDVGLRWNASNDKLSISGYCRNFTDNRYKTNVLINSFQPVNVVATRYAPLTFGLIVQASL
jgi:iron complex outermembrane receptor protein